MTMYKTDYGHDLDTLIKNMLSKVNNNEIVLLNYSICKDGLIFYLTYIYEKV